MAKPKPNRPRLRSSPVKPPGRQAATILHPTPMPASKRSVVRAHEKHRCDGDPGPATLSGNSTPTLAERFYALPGELREHIFSLLLVRLPKFSLPHHPTCPLRTSNTDITPTIDDAPFGDCVKCNPGYAANHRWAMDFPRNPAPLPTRRPTWVSPWRSKWAEPQLNPYICTTCYDERWRDCPNPKTLPCLCARRRDLEVLLVCRRWHAKAGAVFYRSNTFCFEDTATLTSFLSHLRPRWRGAITSISLMAWSSNESAGGDTTTTTTEPPTNYSFLCALLRGSIPNTVGLPNLTHTELDALLLTDARIAHSLMRLGLPRRTKISFSLRRPERFTSKFGNAQIWPHFFHRVLLHGGFPEEVARVGKGERRAWFRTGGRRVRKLALQDAVSDFRKLLERLESDDGAWDAGVYDCSDEGEWERWWYAVGYHCAWLPSIRDSVEVAGGVGCGEVEGGDSGAGTGTGTSGGRQAEEPGDGDDWVQGVWDLFAGD